MSGGNRLIGVTGATGCLGSAWLRHTLERDDSLRVIAIARRPASAADHFAGFPSSQRARIEIVEGDFRDLRFTAHTLERLRRVNAGWWHFAATTSLATDAATAAEARAVNDVGTERLLAVLRTIDTPAPFFQVSTAYVAGMQSGRIWEKLTDSNVGFRNPYERTKAAAERHVWRFLSEGRRGAIFRPSVVVDGDRDSAGTQMPDLFVRAVRAAVRHGEGELILRLPEDAHINLVARDWVVRALASLAGHDANEPTIYHLTAVRNVSLSRLAALAEVTVSGLRVTFRADAPIGVLPETSRLLDRAIDHVRDYFCAPLSFDRSNLDAALGDNSGAVEGDLSAMLSHRL